jgi:hypothetical protein
VLLGAAFIHRHTLESPAPFAYMISFCHYQINEKQTLKIIIFADNVLSHLKLI